MSDAQKRRVIRFWNVASFLQENSRMSLLKMSRELEIPISTLFNTLKEVETLLFHIRAKGQRKRCIRDKPISP
jgi:hypothetical protein